MISLIYIASRVKRCSIPRFEDANIRTSEVCNLLPIHISKCFLTGLDQIIVTVLYTTKQQEKEIYIHCEFIDLPSIRLIQTLIFLKFSYNTHNKVLRRNICVYIYIFDSITTTSSKITRLSSFMCTCVIGT